MRANGGPRADRTGGVVEGLGRRVARGVAAGLLGGLAMTFVLLLLRWAIGVPLPVELVSDRLLPELNVRTFVRLLGRVGGPLRGKELAYLTSFGVQLAAAAVGGALYAAGVRSRRSRLGAFGLLAGVWVAMQFGLWPVLASSYRGLGPGAARLASAAGLLMAFAAYGAVLTVALRSRPRAAAEPGQGGAVGVAPDGLAADGMDRRALLAGLGSVAALTAASGGLAGLLYRRATFGAFGYDGLQLRGRETSPITPNDRFYVVTKNLIDPVVADSLWRLEIAGLVERPASYSLDDLAAMRSVCQEQTLECISNRVGSGLISNAVWTGVRLRDLIGPARPRPEAVHVLLHASDGYAHAITLTKALEPTTLVAHRMNGEPLPQRHGYPARVLVPGTYGEVSVKWVDRIELTERPVEGYYEKQGWKPYFVNTTSRFDSPRSGQRIRPAPTVLKGIAFAGDRGISKVEVSTDGGRSWESAGIGYPGTRLTWSLWSHTWRPGSPGRHELVVRATDGDGELQTARQRGAVPSGATGWHRVRVEVAA